MQQKSKDRRRQLVEGRVFRKAVIELRRQLLEEAIATIHVDL